MLFARYGSSSETWKTGWMRHCGGNSNLNAILLSPTTLTILKGPKCFASNF